MRADKAARFSRYPRSELVNGLSTLLADPHAHERPRSHNPKVGGSNPAPWAFVVGVGAHYRVRVLFSRMFHRRRLWNTWCDEGLKGFGGVALHAGENVLVGLDGEGDLGVAEAFAKTLTGTPPV